jgi:hypothetical protein
MAQSKSVQRSLVTLNLPRRVPALIPYVQSVVTVMTSNAHYPTPVPALSDVSAAVTALQTAESAALSRLKGTVVVRNDKKAALVTLMQELRNYIQKVADADPENAAAIIQSSGLPVKKTAVHKPRVFTAKPGAVSGSVDVVAVTAARRASYEWQYSTDCGKTWIEAAPSLRARTTISGLPVAASVQLRYRSVTKSGPGDWSQPLTVVVK